MQRLHATLHAFIADSERLLFYHGNVSTPGCSGHRPDTHEKQVRQQPYPLRPASARLPASRVSPLFLYTSGDTPSATRNLATML